MAGSIVSWESFRRRGNDRRRGGGIGGPFSRHKPRSSRHREGSNDGDAARDRPRSTNWRRMGSSPMQHRALFQLPRSSPAFRDVSSPPHRKPRAATRSGPQDKYMKALEAPQMVAAFHGGSTLEIASRRGNADITFNSADSYTTGISEQTD